MSILRMANLGLKFALELGAVAAFAIFGASLSNGFRSVLLALALAAIGVVLWGLWAAPKSPRRLPGAARVAFELGFFALAFAALLACDLQAIAVAFGVAVVANTTLLTVFDDWRK